MNQPYFGAYRGGFQTLPSNAYQMMTAPTKQNAETIGKVASGIGSVIKYYMDDKANDTAFQQGSDVQYQDLMSRSQATGVPMNPELAEQYKNIGQMSPQQQAAFQNSLGQEAQRIQSLYNIGNQQRQMQSGDFRQGNAFQILTAPPSIGEPTMPVYGLGESPAMTNGPAYNPLFNVPVQPTPAQSYWNQSMGRR